MGFKKFVNGYDSFDAAYRNFAIRHGLKTSEIGNHESRTMNYKTKFKHKANRIRHIRKVYGNPRKWVRWAKSWEQE